MTGFCGCPAQVRPTLIGVHPPGRNACPGRSSIFSRVPPLRGKVCGGGGGGVRLVAYLRGDARQSSAPIIPGDPNLPRGSPLGVVAYGVWGPVLQSPACGRHTIVGGLTASLPQGRIPPLPRTKFTPIPANDPHLPLFCAQVHAVTARGSP